MAIPIDVQNFINSITDPSKKKAAEDLFNSLRKSGDSIDEAFRRVQLSFDNSTKAAGRFREELNESLDLAKAIVNALEKKEGRIDRAKKAMNGLVSLGQRLLDEERELDAIGERQLERMNKEAKIRLKNFQIEANAIAGKLTVDEKLEQNQQRLGRLEALAETRRVAAMKKKLEQENEILSGYQLQEESYKRIRDLVKERYELEQATSKTFGLTGAALSAATNIASKFGMSHVQDQLEDINNSLREKIRKEIEANDGKALNFGRRFFYAAEGVGKISKALVKGMFDPLFIMEKIYSAFIDVNKESVKLERLTGQNSQALAGANLGVATTVDFLQTAVELTEQLGINAQNAFSPQVIAGAAGLKIEMGLAADEAGGLAVMAQTTTGDIDGMVDGIVETTSAFNKANRAAVSQGQVLKDVAKASDSIKLSLGNNPQLIAKAASAARRLGLELKDVDQIADSLLNFEESISNELEAELLTGKQLNLNTARELALKNDLAGVGNEIFKNSADINEFGKMNRIQQEAYAKALGLTKDQLARIAFQRAIEKGMTEEQAAAAAGVTAESMRQMDVQERISKALDKLAQAFAPILDIVADIADVIGGIISPIAGIVGYVVKFLDALGLVKPILLAIALYFAGGAIAKGIGSMVKGVKDLGKALKDISVSDFFAKFKEIKESYLGGLAPKAAEAPEEGGVVDTVKGAVEDKVKGAIEDKIAGGGDKIAEAADKTKTVAPNAGKSIKQFLQGLAGGIRSFKTVSLADIGKVALTGLALVPLGLAAPGLLLLQMVKPSLLKSALVGIASGLKAFGQASKGLVEFAPYIVLAELLLAGLGLALGTFTPVLKAFADIITSVFTGIAGLVTAVADGFVKMMGAVTMDNIIPMMMLGPALLGIAAGLAAIAFAGPMALPALLGVAMAAGAVTTLFGGGEEEKVGAGKEDDSSIKALNEKVSTLIEVVRNGHDIYLDSNKVGRAQSLAVLKSD